MNPEAFILALEDYFAKYKPIERLIVADRVRSWTDEQRRQVFNHVVDREDNRYKKAPAVAVLLEAYRTLFAPKHTVEKLAWVNEAERNESVRIAREIIDYLASKRRFGAMN